MLGRIINSHLRHLTAFVAFGLVLSAQATVRYCAPEPLGNDANDGLTPQTPKTFMGIAGTLSTDDELRCLPGTYYPTAGNVGSHALAFGGPVVFRGWDAEKSAPADPKEVIFDLDAKYGLFYSVRGLQVYNLTIRNAHARTYNGGAICLASNSNYYNEPAIVSNCIFKANYAYVHAGGAVSASRPATVVGCFFDGNTNDTDAGALYLTQSSQAIGCVFVGNASKGKGGAVFSSGSQIVGCVFSNNTATSHGGAIYGSADLVRGCTIVSNRAADCGGAYAWNGTAVTVFDGCLISNNIQVANGNWACGGGALFLDNTYYGKLSMTNCTVVCNRSATNGGAVLMRYASLFEAFGCTFDGNYADGTMGSGSATSGAGAWYWFLNAQAGSTNRFVDCTVRNHRWRGNWEEGNISGGVVYSTAETVILSGCTFSNDVGQAANMYEFGASVKASVENCTFSCVTNTKSGTSGGLAGVSSACTVTGCVFRGNRAGKCGLATGGAAGTTNAYRNCVFADNYSLLNSLVSSGSAFLEVSDCTFADNVLSNGYGATSGGICIGAGGKVAIDRCCFRNNTNDVYTGASGGAMFLYASSAANVDPNSYVRNCLFVSNGCGWHANRFGPAICLVSGTTSAIPIENCTFANHSIGKAPVQCLSGTAWTEQNLVNCAFAGNVGTQSTSNFDHSWQGALADAKFVAPETGDYCPIKNSPLVNIGAFAEWMSGTTDLVGKPRIYKDAVDIGCYEFVPEKFGFCISIR